VATWLEAFDSRDAEIGPSQPTARLRYVGLGSEDDGDANASLQAVIPATYPGSYGVLTFAGYTIRTIGAGLWFAVVTYTRQDSQWQFDTTGGTQKITQSLASTAMVADTDPPIDCGGAINAKDDSVEGVEITVPVFAWSETYHFSPAFVTNAYIAALFNLTGTINLATFRTFDPGCVLFKGARGAQKGDEDYEITFSFAGQPPTDGLTIDGIDGEIGPITKRGWDLLEIRYQDNVSGNQLLKKPVAAIVHTVYPDGDFSQLAIGG
jgi:hypothetical protein